MFLQLLRVKTSSVIYNRSIHCIDAFFQVDRHMPRLGMSGGPASLLDFQAAA